MSQQGGPHSEAPGSVTRQGEREEFWATAFIVVSVGRNKYERVIRLRIG